MGGKNIIIVLEDANLDLAVDGAVWGGFGTTGQRCTAASRVAVHKSVYHEFVTRFTDRVKKLKSATAWIATVEMGPCINEQQLKTVMDYVAIGKNEGAKLLTGGNRLDSGAYREGLVPRTDGLRRLQSEDADLRRKKFLDRWFR